MQVVVLDLCNPLFQSEATAFQTFSKESSLISPKVHQEGADSCFMNPDQNRLKAVEGCNCKLCTGLLPRGTDESTWKEMLPIALQALTERDQKQYFHMKKEILPFIEAHWNLLWPRDQRLKWTATVGMVLSKYPETFKSARQDDPRIHGYWGLRSADNLYPKQNLLEASKEPRLKRRKSLDSSSEEGKTEEMPVAEIFTNTDSSSLFKALMWVVNEEISQTDKKIKTQKIPLPKSTKLERYSRDFCFVSNGSPKAT